MKTIKACFFLAVLTLFSTNKFADGWRVDLPGGGEWKGDDPGTVIHDTVEKVREDPTKLIVNPMGYINTTGIPTPGDIFEFIVKNPDKTIELIQNPGQWPYIPVAAGIIASRNAVIAGGGHPIPDHIRQYMRRWYADDLINSVRWTSNWSPIQNSLQAAQMSFNSNTLAITVLNAIVFRSDSLANDDVLWAHELYHVQQYREWGVFGFSKRWVDNSSVNGPVEAPAYQRGSEAKASHQRHNHQQNITQYREHVWIEFLYRDLLGREPDIFGLDGWCRSRNSGTPAIDIVDGFLRSEEFCTRYATSLYHSLLNREPDAGGLNAWKNALMLGVSFQDVIVGFCDSQEFKTIYSVPGGFVEALYNKLLGRPSDPSGYTGWVDAINSGRSTAAVIRGFLTSEEYAAQRVTENYRNYLHRDPDPQGFLDWTNAVRSGVAMQDIIRGFLASDEYRNAAIAR